MSKVVVLDAGHGGYDSGAVGNGIREKDITLSVALETERILLAEYTGVKVIQTRRKDVFISLADRSRISNSYNTALFVSIHVNSASNPSATGYETYMTTTSSQVPLKREVHSHIDAYFRKAGFASRGLKRVNFYVLWNTKAPAILTENLFIVNRKDANFLKNNVKGIARAHAEAIAKALKLSKKTTTNPSKPPTGGTLYRVQVGAYRVKTNANAMQAKLKKAGFDAFVKKVGSLYKVQVGAYSVKTNANAMQSKLKKAGFDAFITTK